MSDRQEESPSPTSRRLRCGENREYTKAILLLACIALGTLVVYRQWTILAGIAGGIIAFGVISGLWARWQHNDPIRKMDRNLPRISFDEES